MSTLEEDVTRVREVTEALAGPLKVWVLQLSGDHGPTTYLHRTREGALDSAAQDMETFYYYERDGKQWRAQLDAEGHVRINGAYGYDLYEKEILS